jgi:O-antigen/teichoic acid export membrane protein
MLNGVLLFCGGQGDRLLIGKELGLAELGHYSAALLLIYTPTAILQRFVAAIYLPLVSSRGEGGGQSSAANQLAERTLLLAILISVCFALVAPFAITLLFGAQFKQSR